MGKRWEEGSPKSCGEMPGFLGITPDREEEAGIFDRLEKTDGKWVERVGVGSF